MKVWTPVSVCTVKLTPFEIENRKDFFFWNPKFYKTGIIENIESWLYKIEWDNTLYEKYQIQEIPE